MRSALPELALLLIVSGSGCTPKPPKAARLQAYDDLVVPGKRATLRAKAEKKGVLGIHPDLHGQPVLFVLGGKTVGRAVTGRDGLATLSWMPPASAPAVYRFDIRFAPGGRYAAPDAPCFVFVRDPKRPVLVVDLDHTICDASGLAVATRPPRRIPAMPGSVAALRALAARYDLIYLSARDDALITKTRAWLELRKFPAGPLLVRDIGLGTLSAGRYKRRRLDALRRRFALAVGVGDRRADAEAYLAAGMRAILIGDEDEVPEGAERYPDWARILAALK